MKKNVKMQILVIAFLILAALIILRLNAEAPTQPEPPVKTIDPAEAIPPPCPGSGHT